MVTVHLSVPAEYDIEDDAVADRTHRLLQEAGLIGMAVVVCRHPDIGLNDRMEWHDEDAPEQVAQMIMDFEEAGIEHIYSFLLNDVTCKRCLAATRAARHQAERRRNR